jgi:hypothetical protein
LRDEPAARLQVEIKSIHVNNDRDGFWTGDGDLHFAATFWRCTSVPTPCSESYTNEAQLMAEWDRNLQAASGSTQAMNHVLPLAADVRDGLMVSEDEGLIVQSGRNYVFQVWVWEKDVEGGDFMGGIQRVVNESNGWGVGSYDAESAGLMPDGSLRVMDFICPGCGEVIAGDYTVTYEIHRTPLADLHAKSVRFVDPEPAPDSTDPNVCLTVENVGVAAAGPFTIGTAVDTAPLADGLGSLPGLAAGGTQESCVHATLPSSGAHQLDMIADVNHSVPESDETNNITGQSFARAVPQGPTGTGPAQANGPTNSGIVAPKPSAPVLNAAPSPSPTQADLIVSAIKVNGQVPDGKNDCKDGKSSVSVVVKNAGAGKAERSTVRLTVDDADGDADEQSVNGLEAGKEREVRFENVRLKKGERQLTAIVDAKSSVGESNEENNEQKVTARCTDAG